jgi:hypothetical protein
MTFDDRGVGIAGIVRRWFCFRIDRFGIRRHGQAESGSQILKVAQRLVSAGGQPAFIRCSSHRSLQFSQDIRGHRVVGDPSVPGSDTCGSQGAHGFGFAGRTSQFEDLGQLQGEVAFPHQNLIDGRSLLSVRRCINGCRRRRQEKAYEGHGNQCVFHDLPLLLFIFKLCSIRPYVNLTS